MTPAKHSARIAHSRAARSGAPRPGPGQSAAGRPSAVRARTSNAPLLVVVACAMGAFLVLKVSQIAFNAEPMPLTIGTALAQENAGDPAGAGDEQAAASANKADGEDSPDPGMGAAKDMANEKASKTDMPDSNASGSILDASQNATKTELEVIERLTDRRKQLEKRARAIDLREKLLKAAEQKLNKKLSELKRIEARIGAAFAKEKKERSKEFMDLVSLYENMKPKQAARIFDQLDMDILLSVAQKMNKRKMSAVLSQMNAEVAQRLTVEMVARVSGGKTSDASQLPSVVERNPG